MKYENPNMEVLELKEDDIVITSLNEGGTSGEGTGPGVDYGSSNEPATIGWN